MRVATATGRPSSSVGSLLKPALAGVAVVLVLFAGFDALQGPPIHSTITPGSSAVHYEVIQTHRPARLAAAWNVERLRCLEAGVASDVCVVNSPYPWPEPGLAAPKGLLVALPLPGGASVTNVERAGQTVTVHIARSAGLLNPTGSTCRTQCPPDAPAQLVGISINRDSAVSHVVIDDRIQGWGGDTVAVRTVQVDALPVNRMLP